MADTLESLEVEVKHSASGADVEINSVAASIRSLKASLSGVAPQMQALANASKAMSDGFKGGSTKYSNFADALAKVATSAELLKDSVSSLSALANAMTSIAGVKVTAGSFNSLANGIQKVGDAAQSVTPESIENLDKMVASLAKLQGVNLQGLGSAMNAVRKGGTIAKAEVPAGPVPVDLRSIIEASSEVDVLRAKLEALRIALEEAFASGNADKAYVLRGQIIQTEKALERAEDAARKTAEGIDEVGKSAGKSSGPLGNFVSSLKRIAFYRLVRTVIKEITQAIKEGIDNLYEFSKANGDFGGIASRFDGLASSAKTLKNQLGATFGQMLAAAAPALNALMNLLTKVIELLYPFARLIAALEPIITAAAEAVTFLVEQLIDLFDLLGLNVGKIVADDATASWKKANKAAGDYKRTILGFDVINRLNGPNGGGGDNTTGGFTYSPSKRDFHLPDIRGWWTPFISGGRTASTLLELALAKARELANIKVPELKLSVETLPGYSEVLEGLKTRLGELKAGSPYLVTVGAILAPGVQLVFNRLRNWILDLMNSSPYTVEVALATVPSFGKVLSRVWGELMKLKAQSPLVIASALAKVPNFEKVYTNILDHLKKLRGLSPVILSVAMSILPSFVSAFNWVTEKVKELVSQSPIILEVGLQKVLDTTRSRIPAQSSEGLEVAAPPTKGDIPPIETVVPVTEAASEVRESTGNLRREIGTVVGTAALAGAAIWAASQVQTVEAGRVSGGVGGGSFGNRLADALFAAGGYPSTGQMFIARERGPELVGTIGNQTAVANNDQIVEAVSRGVANAVSAVLGRGGKGQEIHVYLDSREIKYGQSRLSRAMGV